MDTPPPPTPLDKLDVKALVIQTLIIFLVFTLVYLLVLFLARDQLEFLSQWIAHNLGGYGIFLITYLLDVITLPASLDMLFPFTISWNPWILLPILCAASILGGNTAFFLGRYLSHFQFLKKWSNSIQTNGESMVRKYGFWAVVAAAVTPIPFSTVCWLAGMAKMSKRAFFLATLFRIPRIIIFYFGILWGLSLF